MRRSTILGSGSGAHGTVAASPPCPACGHPERIHNQFGCVKRECECVLAPGEMTAPAAALPAQLQPPSTRSLDLLDPVCRWCPHRRGRHTVAGSSVPCQRCTCRNFTAPEAPDAPAPPAGPAPAMAAAPAGPASDAEAAPDGAAAGATARAGFGLGLRTPRRADPRPAAQAAPVGAAVVGEDSDADEATAVTVAAVAPVDLTELAAVATPRAAAALDVAQLRALAIDMYQAWLCPKCHARRHDRVPCCKRRLEPVWVAVLPREVSE